MLDSLSLGLVKVLDSTAVLRGGGGADISHPGPPSLSANGGGGGDDPSQALLRLSGNFERTAPGGLLRTL